MQRIVRVHTASGVRTRQRSGNVESWSRSFFLSLKKEADKRLEPLFERLNVASQQEIHHLSRQISQLERRLRSAQSKLHAVPAAKRGPSRWTSKVSGLQKGTLDTRQYADLFWDEV